MEKKASSRDVAQLAGVSQSTVSKVLNGQELHRISEETRQRVFSAARELNYTRHAAARALANGKSCNIGIVTVRAYAFIQMSDYHHQIFQGVVSRAIAWHYNILCHTANRSSWESMYSDIMSGHVDGVLVVGSQVDSRLSEALLKSTMPVVFVSYHPAPKAVSVDCDNEQGGYLALSHLMDAGHRNIAFLFNEDTPDVEQRWHGANRAVTKAKQRGLKIQLRRIVAAPTEGLARLLELSPRPTAVFLPYEEEAYWILEQAQERGLRIPEDLAVVNYNSTPACAAARIPLTSVWQPWEQVGQIAANTLFDWIEGIKPEPGVITVPVRLDIRESSGNPLIAEI